MLGFNYKKAVQLLNFFAISNGSTINKMKALKLIWLSDRLHIRRYARPILNDTYFALRFGPIASNTKDLVESTSILSEEEKNYRDIFLETLDRYNYKSLAGIENIVFSESEIKTATDISRIFNNFSEFQLSELSHLYPEWKKFSHHLESKSVSRFEMNYEDFFKNPNIENHEIFAQSEEHLALSKEIFIENGYIYQLL